MSIDLDKASAAYSDFLRAMDLGPENGVDVHEAGRLVSELMARRMSGMSSLRPVLTRMASMDHHDPVFVHGLPFYSFCAHHFVPFFGTIDIEYVPDDWMAGLGGFCRIVEYHARRPQFQEHLTADIADHIMQDLEPRGVRVTIEARQMCMELQDRGQAVIRTQAVRGQCDSVKTS